MQVLKNGSVLDLLFGSKLVNQRSIDSKVLTASNDADARSEASKFQGWKK